MRDGSCCLLKTLNITRFLEKHEKLPAVFLWLELEVRALGAVRARGAVCPSCSARCSRVPSPGEQPGVGGARAAADPRVAAGTAAPADTLRPPALSRVSHRRGVSLRGVDVPHQVPARLCLPVVETPLPRVTVTPGR